MPTSAPFLEEAAGYEFPDFGYAGSMTFGVCAAVILEHASEEFKRRHLPRMLKGEELWVQFFSEPSGGIRPRRGPDTGDA